MQSMHSTAFGHQINFGPFTQMLRIMKMSALLVLLVLQAAAHPNAIAQVTLKEKAAPLEKVLKAIKKQSAYGLVFDETLVRAKGRPVSIEVSDRPVEEVLAQIFRGQDQLTYTLNGKIISVKERSVGKLPAATKAAEANEPPQPITVRGRVVNEKGEAVSGATISIKGGKVVGTTGNKGEFTINVPDGNVILMFSAVNIQIVEMKLNGRTELSVQAKLKISELDEVVVSKGYYTVKQRENTGNVSVVRGEDIAKQPVSNPVAALTGRVPGLIITQNSGVAGSDFKIQIRGRTSLDIGLTRNDPLFVIDGVPFESGNIPINQISSAATPPFLVSGIPPSGISPLNSINPSDIESIEVLKDADATSIYGSRGANGVILITTNKAKIGKTKISAGITSGVSRVSQTMDMLNTQQYVQMRKEAFANDGIAPTASNAPDLLLWDTTRYTDFKNSLIDATTNYTDAQVSVSGGSDLTQFVLRGSYMRQTNSFPGKLANIRGAAQINVFHSPTNKKWDSRLSVIFSSSDNKLIRYDLSKHLILPPTILLYTSSGRLNWQEAGVNYSSLGFVNPFSDLERKYSSLVQNLSANLVFNYHLISNLTLRTSAGYNILLNREQLINPKVAIAPENNTLASSEFSQSQKNNWIIEPQVEYQANLGKGKLFVLAGTTFQQRTDENNSINAGGYNSDLLLNSISAASTLTASNDFSLYRYNAFFARVNYNLVSKYILNLTGRRDGSSRFGIGRQFSNFGAIGFAWLFSNENWMKNKSIVSFGKIRSSYGVTGNDQIGDYKYLDLWASTSNPYTGITGLRPTILFNPDYHWEKNNKLELALEIGLWGDRILLSSSYYSNRSSNQLVNYRLPTQTGFSTVVKNLPALVQNSGLELTWQSTNILKKEFNWKTSFNISLPNNKLISFPGLANSSYNSIYVEGKSLTVIRSLKYLGVDPVTGLYTFEDIDDNGTISGSDNQISGDLDPGLYGGLNNSFHWKNWQFDIFFEFRNQRGSNYLNALRNYPPGYLSNQPSIVLNRWQKPGDITDIQRYTANSGPARQASLLLGASDGIYSDASYVRCKNISLSYELSPSVLKKLKMEMVKFSLNTQNLFVITKYKGADPETQNFFQLPPLRTVVLGIQINF